MKRYALLAIGLTITPFLSMCGNDGEGIVPAGTIVNVDPVADTMMAQAQGYYDAGMYAEARSLYSNVAIDRPTAPAAPLARLMMAKCYEAEEEYRDAFKQYQRVVSDYPNSALYEKALQDQMVMASRAVSGDIKGEVFWGAWNVELDSTVVIEWLQKIIANAPYNDMAASTTSMLGKYLVEHERYDEACQVYTQLVEKYPFSKLAPASQMMVANLWALKKSKGDQNLANLSKAEEAYEEYFLRFPDNKEAQEALKKAKEMRSLMVDQELEVAKYYFERAQQYNAALFCLNQVVAKSDVNPTAAAEAKALIPVVEAAAAVQPKQSGDA